MTLGAGVTHAMIEDGRMPDPSRGLMPHAAAGLAYRAIRNRGTIGGSLALSDPAAEWPAVLAALDAEAIAAAGRTAGARSNAPNSRPGSMRPQLADDEIIESIRIPKLSADARWGYLKLCRKSGEFASALAVAVADPAARSCRHRHSAPPTARRCCSAKPSRYLADGRREPEGCATPSPPISTMLPIAISTISSAICMTVAAMRAVREVTA